MNDNLKNRITGATNGSQFGAILSAALGIDIPAPYFAGRAIVTSDNFVMANFVDRDGTFRPGAFVGSGMDLIRNTDGLAKHLGLTAEERAELFSVVRGWISTDYSGRLLKMLEA